MLEEPALRTRMASWDPLIAVQFSRLGAPSRSGREGSPPWPPSNVARPRSRGRRSWLRLRLFGLGKTSPLPIVLGGDPAAHVLGAVHEPNPPGFGPGQKAHRGPIDERDVLQIEGDAPLRFVGQELLQLGRMLDVHVSTQSEHDHVRCCQAMDAVGQSAAPWRARESKVSASAKWLVLLKAPPQFANFLRRVAKTMSRAFTAPAPRVTSWPPSGRACRSPR